MVQSRKMASAIDFDFAIRSMIPTFRTVTEDTEDTEDHKGNTGPRDPIR